MIETLIRLSKLLVCAAPFVLFALLNMKANLKQQNRSRQFLMPILALVYCIVLSVLLNQVNGLLHQLLELLPSLLEKAAGYFDTAFGGALSFLSGIFTMLGGLVDKAVRLVNPVYLMLFVSNAVFMVVHVILKRILVTFMKMAFKPGNPTLEFCIEPFYEKDEESGVLCIRDYFGQARTFLKTLYISTLVLTVVAMLVSCELYRAGRLAMPFYPVFSVIVLGEMYFFLNGLNKREAREMITGEADSSKKITNYVPLRSVLTKLFKDKLGADNTTVDGGIHKNYMQDEALHEMEESDDMKIEAYGRFMRRKHQDGLKLDRNYLTSGLALLQGNSILFNNPFYYDLIPYMFYPMNRVMLRGKKTLIILGRHNIEEDIDLWCNAGLNAVTNVPGMWRTGVLSSEKQELDVGIVAHSMVHDLTLHEANKEFFKDVEFVVIIEPSKLVTTAQIGMNSIIRYCRQPGKQITFCSTDKNCDGLVDALSHLLQTNLTEVSATNHHTGTSSYMCWEPDDEHLQHRLMPNLSRYLGIGTELSFVALKHQVSETEWYGGNAFPVTDIHWIAKQYYYDLLRYADLPMTQESIDKHFKVTPNLWDAKVKEDNYLTVEDEAFNVFEVRRAFATRAKNQGFINVISSEYLLKDYMLANDSIFNADPKAIPYIVADYAATPRNAVLGLCLRMSLGLVSEEEIRQELILIDVPAEHPAQALWHQICLWCRSNAETVVDKEGLERLEIVKAGVRNSFGPDTIRLKRRFNMDSGLMENMYFISDSRFTELVLGDIRNAKYIAEDGNGEKQYLGTELLGHIFQKFLPGQFFTMGGKYYEMLRATQDGRVLLRRAADHIVSRPAYRQVRNYYLSNVEDSTVMGDTKVIAGMQITTQYADIRVETPAYWQLQKYNDFKTGKKVEINGVPERFYRRKQILRIDLPNPDGSLTREVLSTVTVLFNEVFRTLFAENQVYISAMLPGEVHDPMTYSVRGENGFLAGENSIYIVEDSHVDLGLLVAVHRNLYRIFAIVCDYLDWHMDTLEASLNPPPEQPEPVYALDPEDQEEPPTRIQKIKQKIKGIFGKIASPFKKLFQKIRSLFKKKPKKGEEETPEEEGSLVPQPDGENAIDPTGADSGAVPDTGVTEEPAGAEAEPVAQTEEGDVQAGSEAETDPAEAEEAPADDHGDDNAMLSVLFSAGSDPNGELELQAETEEENDPAGQDVITMEPEKVSKPVEGFERKPYHQRHFLLFGGDEVPAMIAVEATHSYLESLGFGNNELKQAREKLDIAQMIENGLLPDGKEKHVCDFCGVPLTGTEYEVLDDGRDRCKQCGRTSVKTEAEFKELYKTVKRNLETFYGVRITAPVRVQMVNSKKLHRNMGKTFVPTGNQDGRVLGFARRRNGKYTIFIENGAPRLKSTMTMAHELIHIWQYLNWNDKLIQKKYGQKQLLEVYEGMAMWGAIQYAYLIGETVTAKREEIVTRMRPDEYGRGFNKYLAKYPLSADAGLCGKTPFSDVDNPL